MADSICPGTVKEMRFMFCAVTGVVFGVSLLSACGGSVSLDEASQNAANVLNIELTRERVAAVTDNESAVHLVEQIVASATSDGPDGLVISVYTELGGLLVDLDDGTDARCVFLDVWSVVDTPDVMPLFTVSDGGCDPEMYVAALEELVDSRASSPQPTANIVDGGAVSSRP